MIKWQRLFKRRGYEQLEPIKGWNKTGALTAAAQQVAAIAQSNPNEFLSLLATMRQTESGRDAEREWLESIRTARDSLATIQTGLEAAEKIFDIAGKEVERQRPDLPSPQPALT